jgi:hypothetical protein
MKTQLMLCVAGMLFFASALPAGQVERRYKVLSPISHGNLTIFPVVTASTHDTSQFLTLDEGIRSGEFIVSESRLASRANSCVQDIQSCSLACPIPVSCRQAECADEFVT